MPTMDDIINQTRIQVQDQLFPDRVLIAIVEAVDHDIAKDLVEETSEVPEECAATLDSMRLAAMEALLSSFDEETGNDSDHG